MRNGGEGETKYKTGPKARISVTGPSANERIRHHDISLPRDSLCPLVSILSGARRDSVKVSRAFGGIHDKNGECVATRSTPKTSISMGRRCSPRDPGI